MASDVKNFATSSEHLLDWVLNTDPLKQTRQTGENVQRQKGTIRVATYWNDQWLESRENLSVTDGHIDDEPDVYRVGNKEAGRYLDGVKHNDYPNISITL